MLHFGVSNNEDPFCCKFYVLLLNASSNLNMFLILCCIVDKFHPCMRKLSYSCLQLSQKIWVLHIIQIFFLNSYCSSTKLLKSIYLVIIYKYINVKYYTRLTWSFLCWQVHKYLAFTKNRNKFQYLHSNLLPSLHSHRLPRFYSNLLPCCDLNLLPSFHSLADSTCQNAVQLLLALNPGFVFLNLLLYILNQCWLVTDIIS